MESNIQNPPKISDSPKPLTPVTGSGNESQQRKTIIIISVIAVLILGALVTGLILLIKTDVATTGKVRDIFIIFMALESIIIGVALIILVIQLATLINLLQNEIKPIIDSTNDTANTLRGTVAFLSENLTEPVIKLNEYLAAIKKFSEILRPSRSGKK